jgi:hypothetical protein
MSGSMNNSKRVSSTFYKSESILPAIFYVIYLLHALNPPQAATCETALRHATYCAARSPENYTTSNKTAK